MPAWGLKGMVLLRIGKHGAAETSAAGLNQLSRQGRARKPTCSPWGKKRFEEALKHNEAGERLHSTTGKCCV